MCRQCHQWPGNVLAKQARNVYRAAVCQKIFKRENQIASTPPLPHPHQTPGMFTVTCCITSSSSEDRLNKLHCFRVAQTLFFYWKFFMADGRDLTVSTSGVQAARQQQREPLTCISCCPPARCPWRCNTAGEGPVLRSSLSWRETSSCKKRCL